jgi:WD40 repeat protein
MKGGSLGEVYQVGISPNNKYFLSVSALNAKIWTIENGNLFKILPSRLGYPNAPFVFSSDGKFLYYGDYTDIKCIYIEKDSLVKIYTSHKNNVYGLSLSTDGLALLSCASDSSCIIWDLTGDSILKVIKMPEQIKRIKLFKEDKTILADGWKFSYIVDSKTGRIKEKIKSGGDFSHSSIDNLMAFSTGTTPGYIGTNKISVYDTSGRLIKNHFISARGFCLTPDGKYLVICQSNMLKVYDSETGDLIKTIKGEFDLPVTVSPDGKWLAANMEYSNDSLRKAGTYYIHAVGLFDFKKMEQKSILIANQYSFRPPAFSNDSRFLGTTDLNLWDIDSGKLVRSFVNHHSQITKIITNDRNKLGASLSETGEVIVWESETGKTISRFKQNYNIINNIHFTEDGENIVASSYYESEDTTSNNYMDRIRDSLSITFWNVKSGKFEKEIDFRYTNNYSVSFSPEENKLFLTSEGKIKVFDIYSKELLNEFSLPDNYYDGMYSPQMNYLEFEDYQEGRITIYNIKEGKILFTVQAHRGFVRTISWSNNERILVTSGQDDNSLKVWEMPDGKLLKTFKLDKPNVHYGSVSPDGKYFAGSSKNGYIFIWELEKGEIIRTFNESSNYIWYVKWSPDGRFVFEGDSDGTVIAWRTNLY